MEPREEIVDPWTAAQVETWIPLARPVTPEPTQLPPPPVGHEMLLLSQSRRDVVVDILVFVGLFLSLALAGELAIASIYHAAIGHQFTDEDALRAVVARKALFPAIAWRTLTATFIAVWITRRRGLSLRSVGLTLHRIWLNLLLGVVAFVAIMVVAVVSAILINALFPSLSREFEKNAEMIMAAVPRATPAFLFGMCLAIGYYEELIFRGFLMTRLRRATNSWTIAVLANSAVFVPLHLMDQAGAALLAIGSLSLLFSVVTIWRRSLIPAILAHALFNFTMFIQLYYQAGDAWK